MKRKCQTLLCQLSCLQTINLTKIESRTGDPCSFSVTVVDKQVKEEQILMRLQLVNALLYLDYEYNYYFTRAN